MYGSSVVASQARGPAAVQHGAGSASRMAQGRGGPPGAGPVPPRGLQMAGASAASGSTPRGMEAEARKQPHGVRQPGTSAAEMQDSLQALLKGGRREGDQYSAGGRAGLGAVLRNGGGARKEPPGGYSGALRSIGAGGGPPSGSGAAGRQLDFDEEARKLWARLNLDPSQVNNGPFNALDPLWRHPQTGGTFFVGNQMAASSLDLLMKHNITHVVNCTDSMPLYHEGSGKIKYFRFDITSHYRRVRSDEEAVAFAQPVLDFISTALSNGHNVMAHCLAGAHRAGTTGVISLMYFANLSAQEAVPVAKKCRPIIDPIGQFPELIAKLDRGWKVMGKDGRRPRS